MSKDETIPIKKDIGRLPNGRQLQGTVVKKILNDVVEFSNSTNEWKKTYAYVLMYNGEIGQVSYVNSKMGNFAGGELSIVGGEFRFSIPGFVFSNVNYLFRADVFRIQIGEATHAISMDSVIDSSGKFITLYPFDCATGAGIALSTLFSGFSNFRFQVEVDV